MNSDNAIAITSTHRAGSVLGIEVRFMYVVYPLLVLLLLSRLEMARGAGQIFAVTLSILMLPVCIFLHEMGHSLAAIKDGVSVRQIVLHPLGGVAQLDGHIPGPMSEIMIALAGPMVSLLIAAFSFLPIMIMGGGIDMLSGTVTGGATTMFFANLFITNIFLALFNLLPIFPLDGGRVATAIAIMKLGVDNGVRAMSKISKAGVAVLVLIGLLFIFRGSYASGIMMIAIGAMAWFRGQQEMAARMYASFYAEGAAFDRARFSAGGRDPWASPDWNSRTGFAGVKPAAPGFLRKIINNYKERKQAADESSREELNRQVDEILAKVKRDGIGSLSTEERNTLNRASREYKD